MRDKPEPIYSDDGLAITGFKGPPIVVWEPKIKMEIKRNSEKIVITAEHINGDKQHIAFESYSCWKRVGKEILGIL